VVYFVSVGWVITSVGGDERNNDDETTKKAEVGHGRGEISEGDDFDNIGHHHHHHLHGNQIVDDEIGKYYSAEGRPEGRPDAKLDSPPDAGVTAGVPKAPKSQKPQRQAAKGSSDRPTESIYTDYYSQKGDIEVPTFFSPPGASLHDGEIKAFGRETPSSLGTGNAEEDTIFLMIASYRDYMCPVTIQSALERATYPSRIRVGVVAQNTDGDVPCDRPFIEDADWGQTKNCDDPDVKDMAICKYSHLVNVFEGLTAEVATGPVMARHVGYRLYDGETYFMQTDAHVLFVEGWDEIIIKEWTSLNNEMAVLSTYLTDVVNSIDPDTHQSLRTTRPIMCNTQFETSQQGKYLRHGSQPEGVPAISNVPQSQPYWAAGFSFSRGHFPMTVPYDPYLPMIFQGEEISIGLRGFTHGYDFYAPNKSVCFHVYASTPQNKAKRTKVKTFWEHSNDHAGVGKESMKRLLGIVKMDTTHDFDHLEEDVYGMGTKRSVDQFFHLFGIDVEKKHAKDKLCQFVASGNMHRRFHDMHVREDKMGIDYEAIGDYKIPAFES